MLAWPAAQLMSTVSSDRVTKGYGGVPNWPGWVLKWSGRVPKWSGRVLKWSGRVPKWCGRVSRILNIILTVTTLSENQMRNENLIWGEDIL